jgi:hypothetical protein
MVGYMAMLGTLLDVFRSGTVNGDSTLRRVSSLLNHTSKTSVAQSIFAVGQGFQRGRGMSLVILPPDHQSTVTP